MLRDSWIIFDQTFQGLGMGKLFPARESLVSDIPAGGGNPLNLFYSVTIQFAQSEDPSQFNIFQTKCKIHTWNADKKALTWMQNLLRLWVTGTEWAVQLEVIHVVQEGAPHREQDILKP